jgi:uncharacterized protein YuzE
MWPLTRRTKRGSYPSTGGKVVVYLDESVDAATIVVSDEPVARTERVEGIGFVDLDKNDNIVAIEVLAASEALERLEQMERHAETKQTLDDELRASASRFVEHARRVRVKNSESVEAEGVEPSGRWF